MNKLAALILSTATLAALIGVIGPGPAGATPVTWSFYETAITSCDNPGSCALPPQPYVLMTLALPGPTSNGTAIWLGDGSQPVYTGDSFTLTTRAFLMRPLTPAFVGGASNVSGSACANGGDICDFNISWSETAGQLTAVDISIDLVSDDIGGMAEQRGAFGLTGGPIGSDGTLGGCGFTQCQIAGFWQSDLSVPEPASVALLASGLFGAWLGRRRRTGQAGNRGGWQVGLCSRFLRRTTGLRARPG